MNSADLYYDKRLNSPGVQQDLLYFLFTYRLELKEKKKKNKKGRK